METKYEPTLAELFEMNLEGVGINLDGEPINCADECKKEQRTTRESLARFRNTMREYGLAAALREDWELTSQKHKRILCYFMAPFVAHSFLEWHPNLDNLCDTAFLYGFARFYGVRPVVAAAGSATVGVGMELMQKAGLLDGTYDPKDIACFIAGSGFAYGLDKLVHSYTKSKVEKAAANF